MVGGAPGVGKTTVARRLLGLAAAGPDLLQWVDVDSLWLHRPWRVDERTKTMVQENLRAVARHAADAGVDVLVITWVYQSAEMHRLVAALLPPAAEAVSVQLHAGHDAWARRFAGDPERPGLDETYESQYAAAQATPADHVVDTDGLAPAEIARRIAGVIGLGGQEGKFLTAS